MKETLLGNVMWDIDIKHMKNWIPIFLPNLVGRNCLVQGEIGKTTPKVLKFRLDGT